MEIAPEALASKISPVNGTCGQRGAVLLSLQGSAVRCFSACILPAVVVVVVLLVVVAMPSNNEGQYHINVCGACIIILEGLSGLSRSVRSQKASV